jgi:hypothetical protein
MNDQYVEDLDMIGSHEWDEAIQSVVMQLPEEIAEWTSKNITFISVANLTAVAVRIGTTFPSEHRSATQIGACRLIVALGTIDEERAEFTVAHEIAHHWLGHDIQGQGAAYERQEAEADALANQWGFAGQSIRVG